MFYDVDASLVDKLMYDFYNASGKNSVKELELWEIECETLRNILKKSSLVENFEQETKALKKEIVKKISRRLLWQEKR